MLCYSKHVLMTYKLSLKNSSHEILTNYVIYFFISIRIPYTTSSQHTLILHLNFSSRLKHLLTRARTLLVFAPVTACGGPSGRDLCAPVPYVTCGAALTKRIPWHGLNASVGAPIELEGTARQRHVSHVAASATPAAALE